MTKKIKISVIIAGILALLFGLYSLAWFGAGEFVKSMINFEKLREKNEAIVEITGFPFDFNIHVKDLSYVKKSTRGNLVEVSLQEAFVAINLPSWKTPKVSLPEGFLVKSTRYAKEGTKYLTFTAPRAAFDVMSAPKRKEALDFTLTMQAPKLLVEEQDKKGKKGIFTLDLTSLKGLGKLDKLGEAQDLSIDVTGENLGVYRGDAQVVKTNQIKLSASAPVTNRKTPVDVDFTVMADQTVFFGGVTPPLTGALLKARAVRMPSPPFTVKSAQEWRKNQGHVTIDALKIEWGKVGLDGKGAFVLDDALQPQGHVQLEVQGVYDLMEKLEKVGILQKEHVALLRQGLGLTAGGGVLGKLLDKKAGVRQAVELVGGLLGFQPKKQVEEKETDQGENAIDFDVSLDHGKLSVGPFTLMAVPPITWADGKSVSAKGGT